MLLLDNGEHLAMLLLTISLPLIGFSLQHLMRRRVDRFTRRLMRQLYEEKRDLQRSQHAGPADRPL
ncbi:hypothetical protein OJE16_21145 [Pantoea tagorei]